MVYTKGITDVSYYQPLLGIFLMSAEAIYCIREPYVSVAYSKGRFRETAVYAYIEAGLNIGLSISLYNFLGLAGIALGTFIAMTYRAIAHVAYLRNHILHRQFKKGIMRLLLSFSVFIISLILTSIVKVNVNSYFQWMAYALVVSVITGVVTVIIWYIFDKAALKDLFKIINRRKI